jgi:hypothetical protein
MVTVTPLRKASSFVNRRRSMRFMTASSRGC